MVKNLILRKLKPVVVLLALYSAIPLAAQPDKPAAEKSAPPRKENIMKQGIFQFEFVPGTLEQHALRIFETRLKKRNVCAARNM